MYPWIEFHPLPCWLSHSSLSLLFSLFSPLLLSPIPVSGSSFFFFWLFSSFFLFFHPVRLSFFLLLPALSFSSSPSFPSFFFPLVLALCYYHLPDWFPLPFPFCLETEAETWEFERPQKIRRIHFSFRLYCVSPSRSLSTTTTTDFRSQPSFDLFITVLSSHSLVLLFLKKKKRRYFIFCLILILSIGRSLDQSSHIGWSLLYFLPKESLWLSISLSFSRLFSHRIIRFDKSIATLN